MKREKPPFKLAMIDGMDWVFLSPERTHEGIAGLRDVFQSFHNRNPSKKAIVLIVHPTAQFDDIFTITQKRGSWAHVRVS